MEDSVRFMLFYASILLSCKDEELADFIDRTDRNSHAKR